MMHYYYYYLNHYYCCYYYNNYCYYYFLLFLVSLLSLLLLWYIITIIIIIFINIITIVIFIVINSILITTYTIIITIAPISTYLTDISPIYPLPCFYLSLGQQLSFFSSALLAHKTKKGVSSLIHNRNLNPVKLNSEVASSSLHDAARECFFRIETLFNPPCFHFFHCHTTMQNGRNGETGGVLSHCG